MTIDDEHKQTLKRAAIALLDMQEKLNVARSVVSDDKIAIIGAACRFPGHIKTLSEYWHALDSGKNCISEVPVERFDVNEYFSTDPDRIGSIYTKAGGFIDDPEKFDAAFFGISPKEAISMDPQQRVFLEVSWEALEAACIAPSSIQGSKTGIFIGVATHDYATLEMYSGNVSSIDDYSFTGVASSVLAARLAYNLDLHGPCISIDTACSSSLVAIHEACKSLLSQESNLAVAGGVNLILSPENTVYFCKINALSRNGICSTFDEAADGYVRSEGCGVVILKRLTDAIENNDNILAVINSSVINQDGRSNGLTAPNGLAQEQLILDALKKANIDSKLVEYVEAHGTGTKLGDPIEVRALSNVYGKERNSNQPLFIGSVKSQIGHLEAAAGVASVIKVCLALQNKKIPGTINLKKLNSNIPWAEIPLSVPVSTIVWPSNNNSKIAAVNSFGLSGTNAHLIMQSYTANKHIQDTVHKYHILTISAKTQQALKDYVLKYRDFILENKDLNIEDICTSSNLCKDHFKFRLALVSDSKTDFIRKLDSFLSLANAGTLDAQASEVKSSEELVIHISVHDLRRTSEMELVDYEAVAKLYSNNEDIDWKQFHGHAKYNKIALPSYPFQHQTYMIKPKKTYNHAISKQKYNVSLVYTVDWKKHDFLDDESNVQEFGSYWIAIICKKDSVLFKKIENLLKSGARLLLITYGEKFNKISGSHFEMDITSDLMMEDFARYCSKMTNFEHVDFLYTIEYHLTSGFNFGDKYIDDLEQFALFLKLIDRKNKTLNLKYGVWLAVNSLHIIRNESIAETYDQAALWGLGKIALLEMPETFKGMLDFEIESEGFDSQIRMFNEKLQHEIHESEIAFRGQDVFVPVINKFRSVVNKSELSEVSIKSNACYLISGGLGGIGLEISKWLVQQGANELILISRNAPKDKNSIDIIESLSNKGVKIHIVSCDISDYIKLKSVFDSLQLHVKLKGVIHAAGSYSSEKIDQLEKNNLQHALNPKLEGLLVLNELTKNIKLDFFVCFSSISAIWGAKNYGAYAAANYFMNVFMDHRRQYGLPGISINCGPWDHVGMAMQDNRKEQFINAGILPLAPEVALSLIDFAIKEDKNNLIIADIDWSVLIDSFDGFKTAVLFRGLEYERPQKFIPGSNSVVSDDLHVDHQKLKLVMQYIITEATKALNLKTVDMFDIDKTFLEQGMDSIAAVHFCRSISENLQLNFTLPSQSVFSYPTIEKLSLYLINQVAINNKSIPKNTSSAAAVSNSKYISENAVLARLNTALDEKLAPCIFIHSGLGDSNYALLFMQDVKRPCYGISLVPGCKYDNYNDIVMDYVAKIRTVLKPNEELILVGYSFGGTVAWGVANKLTELGYKILNLILLDAPALDISSENSATFKDVFNKISEQEIIDKIINNDEDYSKYALTSDELKRLQIIKTVFAEALHSSLNIEKLPLNTIHQLYAYSKVAFLVIDQLCDLPPYAGKVTMFIPFVSRPKEIDKIKDRCKSFLEIVHVNGDHFNMVYENELHKKMQQLLS
jgi:acyl transferase domain-containing protein/thioesterase domain-containing protein